MPIPVTKPFLPPLAEYADMLEGIWARQWITNHGPLVRQLEADLGRLLNVPAPLLVTNGTVAIQIALKAAGITGEVITTPFSYVATTSSIVWEGLAPVMADIDPGTLNIDPREIESSVTERTRAILATHVFGNPCAVEAIERIAQRHKLVVIYDAAHAFGATLHGRSVYSYGDLATASFHATKLFHTCEGGAVFASDPDLRLAVSRMRNFGHVTPTDFDRVGINGKNSELHAAFGLINLRYIDAIIARRKEVCERYDVLLGDAVRRQVIRPGAVYNYAYYPIILESETVLLQVVEALHARDVMPRRYFYPSLSNLPYLRSQSQTPVSDDISRRVLCLPLFHSITNDEQNLVARTVIDAL